MVQRQLVTARYRNMSEIPRARHEKRQHFVVKLCFLDDVKVNHG